MLPRLRSDRQALDSLRQRCKELEEAQQTSLSLKLRTSTGSPTEPELATVENAEGLMPKCSALTKERDQLAARLRWHENIRDWVSNESLLLIRRIQDLDAIPPWVRFRGSAASANYAGS